MTRQPSLRRRIIFGVLCFTVLVSLATSLLAYWVNEQAEQRVWENMLQGQAVRQIAAEAARHAPGDGQEPLRVFGAQAEPIPQEFARLGPGVHDEVELAGRLYVISTESTAGGLVVLALDITEMEQREAALMRVLLLSALLVTALLAAFTYLGAQWLVRPLTQLSQFIAGLRPGIRGQQVPTGLADPLEVAVISGALNRYLDDIDRYVEREHAFLSTASHELRTPIAVIAGAAELAAEQSSLEHMRADVLRIRRATSTMQQLVALLLALARDPARLRASAVTLDLADLVPRVVADHEYLLAGKDLKVVCGTLESAVATVPESLAASAIGNLLRNAIENNMDGVVTVALSAQGLLTIDDPGSQLSAGERSTLHARLARAAVDSGGGIGLDLVGRLCAHLGWALAVQARPSGATHASLQFPVTRSASASSPGPRPAFP